MSESANISMTLLLWAQNFRTATVGAACTMSLINMVFWYSLFKNKSTVTSILVITNAVSTFMEAFFQLFVLGTESPRDKVFISIVACSWVWMLQGIVWLTRDRLRIFSASQSKLESWFIKLSPFAVMIAQLFDFVFYFISLFSGQYWDRYFTSAIIATVSISVVEIISSTLIISKLGFSAQVLKSPSSDNMQGCKQSVSADVVSTKMGVLPKSSVDITTQANSSRTKNFSDAIHTKKLAVRKMAIISILFDLGVIVLCIVQDFLSMLALKPLNYSIRLAMLLLLYTISVHSGRNTSPGKSTA
ncbi:hypothetical protein BKA69DRAFT_202517 [Paraphysoderma sedebokerense]|nr:hypothetical protein BKA69DRAFT_202517 [Paraphysoderma sedebokerense]